MSSSPLASYLPLNPFVDLSVGEAEMWGARAWLDVPEIHAAAFARLQQTVELVRAVGRTQVRFVRGTGGSGKSHLFARVRRELGASILYAYAANPPLSADTLEGFLLGKIVGSLRHKARLPNGEPAPYTQLRLLAYALLKPVIEQSLDFEEMHQSWQNVAADERKDILHGAMLMLESEYPMVPRAVLRCLLNVLRDDKENLAAQWLAGTTYLTEADLRFLGEPEPLVRELHGVVIHLLGKLAKNAERPFVLVLDQLDLVSNPDILSEFQRLLFALTDQSENWCVLIGLIGDRFRFWEEGLTQALKGRLGVPDLHNPEQCRLHVVDVSPIVTADKEMLIRRRMESPALRRQREADGIDSDVFPLRENDIAALTEGGAVYARHLLAACSERYCQTVQASSSSTRMPLVEKVDALLEEAMEQARLETPYLSAVEMGERVKELMDLLCPSELKVEQGPLRELNGEYDGTDHRYTCGDKYCRVVVCDLTRTPFMRVLERLQGEDGHTILIRGASTGALGQVTYNLFERFQQGNHFLQLSGADMDTLTGLGTMLASLREGNYEQLLTDPPATRESITEALRNSGRLRSTKVWQAIQKASAGKPDAPQLPPVSSLNGSSGMNGHRLHPGDSLTTLSETDAEQVRQILKAERWMEINRLLHRLQSTGCECDVDALRYALRTSSLASQVLLHPADPILTGGGPQIVLWHDTLD